MKRAPLTPAPFHRGWRQADAWLRVTEGVPCARGGRWLTGHGGPLLPTCNAAMSSAKRRSTAGARQRRAGLQERAEGEAGSLLGAGPRAWAAFAGNRYKDCFERWEEGQKWD